MPAPLKAVRVLMYIMAGLTALMTVAILLAEGISAPVVGAAVWFAWPGVVSFVLAKRIRRGGIWLWRGIIALQAYYMVLALAVLGSGDPRGIVNLLLPGTILALITRPPVREYAREY